MQILRDSHSHLTVTLITGVKQGKGCDYSVQRSWADHAPESKISLTGAQNESLGKIILWLKHKISRAELCSQKFCSTFGVWPRASHEFSVPISSLVKMMTMIMSILSRIMSEYAITHIFKCFSFFIRKCIANISVRALFHPINQSKLTQSEKPQPSHRYSHICSIRKHHSSMKPLLRSVRKKWKAVPEQHLSKPAFHMLVGSTHRWSQNIKLMGSLKNYVLFLSLCYSFPEASYSFVLLLVQSNGDAKLYHEQTDSELSTCWMQWKDFTHQPKINTSSLFSVL